MARKKDPIIIKGWSEGRNRWGDSSRLAHLMIDRGDTGTGSGKRWVGAACNAKRPTFGLLEKAPREGLYKCGLCARIEAREAARKKVSP